MCIANSKATTKKKNKEKSITEILRKQRKYTHMTYSIKTTKGKNEWKVKIGKRNRRQRQ